jgi:hypothetical protein
MVGDNGVRVYGLDRDKLQKVAARINAPSLRELAQPIGEPPAHWTFAFRGDHTFG